MTIDNNTILTENQQKLSILSPEEVDKYEYLTGVEILLSDQSRLIEQAEFAYSHLRKAFE